MKLNQFKIGDIILKEDGPGGKLIGPVEFFDYENGLLFCAPVHMPDTFFTEAKFFEGIKAIQIAGKRVHILKMNPEDDNWFKFPIKNLNKIKVYLATKYPRPTELESDEEPISEIEETQQNPFELTEEQAQDFKPPATPPLPPADRSPSPGPPVNIPPPPSPSLPNPPGPPNQGQLGPDRGAGFVG